MEGSRNHGPVVAPDGALVCEVNDSFTMAPRQPYITLTLHLLWSVLNDRRTLTVPEALALIKPLQSLTFSADSPHKLATDTKTIELPEIAENHVCTLSRTLDGVSTLRSMAKSLEQIVLDCNNCLQDSRIHMSGGKLITPTRYMVFLLQCALEHGAADAWAMLAESGVSVLDVDDDGRTVLMWAAIAPGGACIVRILLDAQADVDAMDHDGVTALMWASMVNSATTVRELIAAGADINACNYHDMTALIVAARHGSLEATQVLLASGAELEAQDYDDRTALMSAAAHGHEAVFHTLLAAGAATSVFSRQVHTLLMHAAEGGNVSLVRFCVDGGGDVNASDLSGCTPLMHAAAEAQVDVMKVLVGANANVLARDTDGKTALSYAVSTRRAAAVKALIELKADVNATDDDHTTVLTDATLCSDNAAVIETLVAAGANLELTGQEDVTGGQGNEDEDCQLTSYTPLLYAIRWGKTDSVRTLLRLRANVHAQAAGMTALLWACAGTHTAPADEAIVRMLLQAGARVEDVDESGFTALMHAACNSDAGMVALVAEAVHEQFIN